MNEIASMLRRLVVSGTYQVTQLHQWRDQAIEKVASNSGQTIVNASGHGIAFTASGRMTWHQWAALLDNVILSIERNVKTSSRSVARF